MWLKNLLLCAGIGATLVAGSRPTAPPAEPEGSVSGRVVLVSVEDSVASSLFMLIDEANEKRAPDGRVDRVIKLQVEPGIPKNLAKEFDLASVSWTRHFARLSSIGGRDVVFATKDAGLSDATFEGYGLGQMRNWRLRFGGGPIGLREFGELRTSIRRLLLACPCSAGGPGATWCSVSGCKGAPTGCEITCQSGYDPCCGCDDGGNGACCGCMKQKDQ